jgi:transcriptional regulator with GAF, ATPase, and Fis domain
MYLFVNVSVVPFDSETPILFLRAIDFFLCFDVYNIDAATKKMKFLNEDLERSYQDLEKGSNLLNRLYDIVQLLSKKDFDLEEVSQRILKFAISVVYPANLGSISINRYGRWFFLATIGHDKARLNSLNLSSKYFIMPKKPILIKNIQDTDIEIMPKDLYKVFIKCLVPIKETILVPIHVSGAVLGNIALDISASSDKSFTDQSLEQLNDIASVVSSFLTIKSYNDSKIEFEKDILT